MYFDSKHKYICIFLKTVGILNTNAQKSLEKFFPPGDKYIQTDRFIYNRLKQVRASSILN